MFQRQAETRFQALGYTSDDAMDVIASLSLHMFRKTHHYPNGTFDDYVGDFESPGGDIDPLYIKLKIVRKAPNDEGLLVISFHRST